MTAAILISKRIACLAPALAVLSHAVPAMAEEVSQIAVYGQVAPRCWVVDPVKVVTTDAGVRATQPRAICNQSRPVLASEVRTIDAEGLVMRHAPAAEMRRAAPASLSARTALEIVVTPQL